MILKRTSASQVESFRNCPRKWHLQRVLGRKTPPSPAQAKGTAIHALLETFARTGNLPEHEYTRLARAAISKVPSPGADLLAEAGFEMPTPLGITFIGFVDLVSPRSFPRLEVYDYKTSSDFRWAKTPEELRRNVQANVYAKWAYSIPELPWFPVPPTSAWVPLMAPYEVEFSHVYVNTKAPASMKVSTMMRREVVEEEWQLILQDVAAMKAQAEVGEKNALEIDGNPKACSAYGGCEFLKDGTCSDMGSGFVSLRRTKQEANTMSKIEDVKRKLAERRAMLAKAEGTAVPEAPTVEATVAVAVGVIPPDAPPREQTAADVAAVLDTESPAKKRARKAKKAEEKLEGNIPSLSVQETIDHVAPVLKALAKHDTLPRKTILLVDTYEVSPESCLILFGAKPVPVDQWLEPIKRQVAEAFEVPDYAVPDFGKGTTALIAAIKGELSNAPPVLSVQRTRARDIMIELALENGWHVFKGAI